MTASDALGGQRYFDDVESGDEFTDSWSPTGEQVVAFLTVSNRTAPGPNRFTDDEEARKIGMTKAIVPGQMSLCRATDFVTDWMGPSGRLRSIDVNFRRPAVHDEPLKVVGLITDTLDDDGATTVKLDVYFENERGERPLQGVAVVELPRR
ncbi:MAG: hypothetical protein DWI59_05810 [Chloroflexi bacterium]|nr:MAG: hypothetical protein DWI59_05810 [Chloroflexota bacterium]